MIQSAAYLSLKKESKLMDRFVQMFSNGEIGRCIKELERIYGVREGSANTKGNNRIGEPKVSADQLTQSDIAEMIGISVDTLQNYKMLSEMIPELEELLDTGIVTKATVLVQAY